MSAPIDGNGVLLPDELVKALQKAIARNLGAFATLRTTVRRHVVSERDRGATLAEIDRELLTLLARAEQHTRRRREGIPDRELATQVAKWSEAFFGQTQ
jgi:hypothetical protein